MPSISEIRSQLPMYADIPDGELVRGLHNKFYSDIPYADFLKKIDFSKPVDPSQSMSGTQKFLSGTGKSFVDVGRGAGQIVGAVPQAAVDEAKKLDKPLMQTGAGIAGNIAGNAALFAPTAMIPGANTYTGAALLGAGAGALQPVATGDSRALNTGFGAGAGVAGQAIGNTLGRVLRPVASKLGPEQEALALAAAKEGIPLTAGQRTGSRPLQITESVMENLPLTSGSQLAGREAQQRAFTAAALRRGGMTGDVAGAAELGGQKAALGSKLSGIAERNNVDFNRGLIGKLADITDDAAAHLPPDATARISGTVDKILAQVDKSGSMSGTNYQGWREPLRSLASEGGAEARYAGQLRKALDAEFAAQISGAEGEAFKGASRQYANTKTIIDAMGGPGNLPAKGQIAPAQLAAALGRSVGREGKALGRGDLNELSRIGQTFVRDQIPNSGTAQRQLIQGLLTAGGGSGLGAGAAAATGNDPLKGAAYGAGVGGVGLLAPKLAQGLMNSSAGQAYFKNGMVNLTPAAREALTNALRTGAIATEVAR